MRLLAGVTFGIVLAASGARAEKLDWVDDWSAGELLAYGQVSVPLSTVKPDSLSEQPNWPEGRIRYATFVFAQSEEIKVPIIVAFVEPAGREAVLYVDSDGDGKLALGEKARTATDDERPPGFGKPEDTVWLAAIRKPFERAAAFRLHPFGGLLTCALRGYCRGELPVGEQRCEALVVDANANMLLDVGADRLYLDENGNGTIDPNAERRGLPPRLEVEEAAFSFSAERPVHLARWYFAPTGAVPVRCSIVGLEKEPTKIITSLSRLGGGIYQLTSIEDEVKLPAGSYNVESLFLRLPADDDTVWTYTFERRLDVTPTELAGDEPVTIELLGSVKLAVSYEGEPRPGEALRVEVNAETETGLFMTACTKGQLDIGGQGQIPATLSLSRLFDTKQILESKMGFG